MAYEVEVKFRATNLADLAEELTSLGATEREIVEQRDTYFAHPSRRFAETDEALRIRRVGDSCVITYKGPKLDTTTKTRKEIELPLAGGGPDFGQWTELLVTLGFEPVIEVAKTRTYYNVESAGRGLEIALDEVAGLGSFVEIETTAASDAEIDSAREAVLQLAASLGLTEPERRGYIEMLLAEDSGG